MSLYNKIIDLQKLKIAWKQVYKNKPKEGVDSVTCEEFEEEKDVRIKQLWNELNNHTYECMPVQLVPIYKGEKVRYISLYTMRDKVIQYSLSRELANLYEPYFSACVYAYRAGNSALNAAQVIYERMAAEKKGYVLRTDIRSFFDNILHELLVNKLRQRIKENDVIDILMKVIKTPSLEKNGTLTEKKRGIYQGATVAPVLSNIYMMTTDEKIQKDTDFYVRYSDDILLIFQTQQEAEEYKNKLAVYLEDVGLELNLDKTNIFSFEEGFEFLGYRFDNYGISVPDKAEKQLMERLENVWLNSSCKTLEARMEKGAEILNGWEQYFTGERVIHSILEYGICVYQMQKRGNLNLEQMALIRENYENPYKDIVIFLAGIWKENHLDLRELWEYEQYYNLNDKDEGKLPEAETPLLRELLNVYARYIVAEAEDVRVELIQIYSDLKMYQKAESLMDESRKSTPAKRKIVRFAQEETDDEEILLTAEELSKYAELFVGREDVYALDGINAENRRKTEEVQQPLLPDKLKEHLAGRETISTYIQRSNGTVKYLVMDLDISKGILLQIHEESVKQEYMNQGFQIALGILKELRHMGLEGYLEQSGSRGYHIWVFFAEWLPVRYANILADIIEYKAASLWKNTGIQIEYFPNKTKLRSGKKGQNLKLPWGLHPKTRKRSRFLNTEGQFYAPQKAILQEIVLYSANTIKKIISANQMADTSELRQTSTEVDRNLQEFGTLSDTVRAVLDSCNLLRYLCQKSRTVHYLNHFERLTILYVFGHLGEDGKDFVHKVMEFTLNYSYQVTQKFILRCPEKPVSCLKLREQYKQITAEIGCSCNFRRTKNCYPSPVLHALKKSEENTEVTIPVSKTLPADKEKIIKNEINAVIKVQEITEKMLELRKQRRSLDKALKRCEQELSGIFDDANTDSMEIKMGLLVRRRNGGNTEWMIEL